MLTYYATHDTGQMHKNIISEYSKNKNLLRMQKQNRCLMRLYKNKKQKNEGEREKTVPYTKD